MSREEDYIWGIHPVCEQLKDQPDSVDEILILKEVKAEVHGRIRQLAARAGVAIRRIDRLPKSLQGTSHQGVALRIKNFTTLNLDELLATLPPQKPPLLVAIDRVQDPGNLGAIIRSCAGAGVDGIIVSRDQTAPLGGTVLKTSAGCAAKIAIARVTNMARALDAIKNAGIWVYGAAADGDLLWESDLSGPACILMGNEHQGIRPLIRKKCDFILKIPMAASVESLNVSAAAAVMIFEAVRQRGGPGQ